MYLKIWKYCQDFAHAKKKKISRARISADSIYQFLYQTAGNTGHRGVIINIISYITER